MLKDLMNPSPLTSRADSSPSLSSGALSSMHQQAMQSSSGIDPFLGQASNPIVENHARQNSADSGLGGMGTNYSLPRTPEDFLSNVEEMDSSNDGGHRLLKHGGIAASMSGCDYSMGVDMQDPNSMDIGSLGEGGDDLVSSLQEDIMSTDLLNDMDIIQKDLLNQTWL